MNRDGTAVNARSKMRKLVGISAIAFLAGIAGSEAQSPVQQSTAGQNNKDQPATSGATPNNLPKPAEPKARNSGPPYSDCYLKCINAGNAADYCQDRASSYCH
jgi:hypothetical protein